MSFSLFRGAPLFALLLTACWTPKPRSDAGPDAAAMEASVDVIEERAPTDVTAETAPEASVDVALEAQPEASIDVAESDVSADVRADVSVDARSDVSADVGCEGGQSLCRGRCAATPAMACDDGNDASGDGCAACDTERGWICGGAPSVCTTICGDNMRAGAEQCDDGNTVSGDGCSASCVNE